MSTANGPIRTWLVSGFLGAGKTTFILEQLNRAGARVAVLVNEFGELGIDGALIQAKGGIDVVEMPGGCICCSQKDGLTESIRRIAEGLRPELLLIEPSGIAETSEVLKVLTAPSLSGVIRLDAAITVLDAETFLEYAEPDTFGTFFLDQIIHADLILVNKADLVGPDELATIERRIAEISPCALVQRTAFCRMDGEIPSGGKILPLGAGSTLPRMECVSVVPGMELSDGELELFLAELSEGMFGRVVVAGRVSLEPFTANADPRLTLIGYGLDGERLRAFFGSESVGKETR